MHDTGVVHGRFQIFHNDHLDYVLAAKAKCRHLIVGITNPDPSLTRPEPADPERHSQQANPLTYFERYTMVRAVLTEAGIPEKDFSVVPLPINLPDLFRFYVPLDAVFFLTIYDEWGRSKLARFHNMGLKTHVLWEKAPDAKKITGHEIRRRIAEGLPCDHLVPPAAAALVRLWNLNARLRPET